MTQSATTLIKKVQQNLESAMSQMADFIKYLYAKNMTQSRSITIFDPRTQQNLVKMITPEDIKGNTSTRVKADSTLQMNQAVLMKLIGDGWRMFANVQDPVETAKMYYDIG